jgi:hypothetical protein
MIRFATRRRIAGLLAAASVVPLVLVTSFTPASALPPGTPPNHPVTMLPATGDSGTDFKLAINGTDQFCAGDGVAGYFWHTFITPLAQDPATLDYPSGTPTGLAPTTFLRSSTAAQLKNQFPGTGDGFVNLNGPIIDFANGFFGTLPAGSYHIGAACTAPASQETDEYWSTIITLTASPGAGPNNFTYQQGIPTTVPGSPTGVTAIGGNAQASVSWTAPASNGGSAITGYVVTPYISGVAQTPVNVGNVLSTSVTGLTNGTAYTFRVAATNAVGTGAQSADSAPVTPQPTVPAAPTAVSAVAGNAEATVSWTAPADNGGSAITDYVVTPYIGAAAQTPINPGNVTSTVVTGLTNGTAYTFRVAATNTTGTGAQSAPSAAVTPATVPGAPTAVGAVGGNAQATVSWTAPAVNGGSAITGYVVTPYIAAVAQSPVNVVGNVASTVVTGLTNGTAYTFRVAATNAVGTGAQSAESSPATPQPTAPAAPTNVIAAGGNTQVTVSWTAPADNGGSAITGYVVTPFIGAAAQTQVNVLNVTSTVVTGLTNGTAYTFRVAAVNAIGTGLQSAPSNSATPQVPATVPGAPIGVAATAGAGSAQVSWTAPASNGGSAVTSYVVTPFVGAAPQTPLTVGNITSTTVFGLTNGTAYTFAVAAVNAVGRGSDSAASAAVTPITIPTAPTAVMATAGIGEALVSWTAPGNTGGSAITGYLVTPFIGAAAQTPVNVGNVTSTTVTGLASGTAYTFKVAATNAAGTGPQSTPSAAVTTESDSQLFTTVSPTRLFDTRTSEPQGVVEIAKRRYSGTDVLKVKLLGVAGVPADGVSALSLNVTAVFPDGPGFVAVFPCGDLPNVSNINFTQPGVYPNAVIAPVSTQGEVCFYSTIGTDLIADLNGWLPDDGGFGVVTPARVFDTRTSEPQAAVEIAKRRYSGTDVLKVKVLGVAGVPASGVAAVSLNVAAVFPDGPGFVAVFPCGDVPNVSNINFTQSGVYPNAVIAPVSAEGEVCFFSSIGTDLIADVNGWLPDDGGFGVVTPTRVFDTRVTEPQAAVEIAKRRYSGTDVLKVKVLGVAGVPTTGVAAVSLNVAAVFPDGPGFVAVFPCGDVPNVSNINFTQSGVYPNAVIAPVSAEGEVCFFSSIGTDLITDVNGWFAAPS